MPRRDRPGDSLAAERRAQAFELRKAGASYPEIGRALGVTKQRAWQYVKGELRKLANDATESSTEVRTLELTRLDHMQRKLWERGAGEPQIVDRVIKVMERRSKLLGLDAATRLEHSLDEAQVQTVIALSMTGAMQMAGDLRIGLFEILGELADAVLRSRIDEMFGERQQVYVDSVEAGLAAALPAAGETAAA